MARLQQNNEKGGKPRGRHLPECGNPERFLRPGLGMAEVSGVHAVKRDLALVAQAQAFLPQGFPHIYVDNAEGFSMLKNTTMSLPDELVARVKAYAAQNRTTMTALVREHLEAITEPERNISDEDPLLAYSKGLVSRRDAVRRLGLRDYADLLVALGDADLPLPLLPAHEVENQAATFAKLWRMG
nr:hypothetical protein [uncultured Gellertiella sp.]